MLRVIDIIAKKRDGKILTANEINFMVQGLTKREIPDYQISAWLMAIYLKGMSLEETVVLTMAMAQSGQLIDLSGIRGIKVDKHSTGGVGDTTTLVVAPIVAAAGVPVGKMSGRGLGFTGGTIDKLEAITGFSTAMEMTAFLRQLSSHRLAIMSQTEDLAPADGLLYALRDVTATVESIPLIASSIMSKKIAAGADKILLDVKVGSGAFMHNLQDAVLLAQTMVHIGHKSGRETIALLTGMDEPLGCAVGNSLEVQEAIDILSGHSQGRLRELCLVLSAHMLALAKEAKSFQEGLEKSTYLLDKGFALKKFTDFIAAQGGDPKVAVNRNLLPTAQFSRKIFADKDAYVQQIDAHEIGCSAVILGAGREFKGQKIDLSAGLVIKSHVGDLVSQNQLIAVLYSNKQDSLDLAYEKVSAAIRLGGEPALPSKLVLGIVDSSGIHLT